ncbi:12165_t:CDS:2 [Acaulospora colombiana]|uniref:12165_t:CDS:1 n=1 Tax=Acaulospora colombiana TaxID=27376 RepID=A0ACA9NSG8_9GLOM|nr:12165_t:CDS:2 [Acaulospora colombiana]
MPEILPTDTTPLLTNVSLPTYTAGSPGSEPIARPEPRRTKSLSKRFRLALSSSIDQAKSATQPSFWKSLVSRVFTSLPAVFLGVLLNVASHQVPDYDDRGGGMCTQYPVTRPMISSNGTLALLQYHGHPDRRDSRGR